MIELEGHPQISPEQESCSACRVEIPAGDQFYAFTFQSADDLRAKNICSGCFARLLHLCGADDTEEAED